MIMEFLVIAVPLDHTRYHGMEIYTNEVKLSGLYSLQLYQFSKKNSENVFEKKLRKRFDHHVRCCWRDVDSGLALTSFLVRQSTSITGTGMLFME